MSDFKEKLKKGKIFENIVYDLLINNNSVMELYKNGCEYNYESIMKKFNDNSEIGFFLRKMPDFIMFTKNWTVYIECKSTPCIDWYQYEQIYNMKSVFGLPTIYFIESNNQIYFQFHDEINFIRTKDYRPIITNIINSRNKSFKFLINGEPSNYYLLCNIHSMKKYDNMIEMNDFIYNYGSYYEYCGYPPTTI